MCVINAALAVTATMGTTHDGYRLITTLLDQGQAPALGLVGRYNERWEIETVYCELKKRILGGRVLRGRHPGAVSQEMWALLACYQVLCTAMSDATLAHSGVVADRLSFGIALRVAGDQVIQARGILSGSVVDLSDASASECCPRSCRSAGYATGRGAPNEPTSDAIRKPRTSIAAPTP